MDRRIWKYPIPAASKFAVDMPEGAIVLHAEIQNGNPFMWVTVDTEAGRERRLFTILGTGEMVPLDAVYTYVCSFQRPPHVWHLFEVYGLREELDEQDEAAE